MSRKASPETQLRRVKSQLNARIRYESSLIAELRERRRIGGMLSNIAYNLAQLTDDQHLREVLDECRRGWDEIRKVPL